MQLYKISLQNKALTWMDLVPNFWKTSLFPYVLLCPIFSTLA
jgi:hypothetical protein